MLSTIEYKKINWHKRDKRNKIFDDISNWNEKKKVRGFVGLFVWHPIILINWKNSLSHETWSNSRINKYDFCSPYQKCLDCGLHGLYLYGED